MKFAVEMKFSVLCLIFLTFCEFTSSRLCSFRVPVRTTKNVLRTSFRITTYRNWIGMIQTERRPYTYYDTEYTITTQLKYDCCFGYSKINGKCEPICRSACPANGFCSELHNCECNRGYELSRNDNFEESCIPICADGCPKYSNCTSPDFCTCLSGYSFNYIEKECVPICDEKCPDNSFCADPNKCECTEGYEKGNSMNGTEFCQPLCPNDCPPYAQCASPGECSCDAGYAMAANFCEPQCELACPSNSLCISPNKCLCHRGHELDIYSNNCVPACSSGCPAYSHCVDIEVCECENGYTMNKNRTQCNPVCTKTCPEHSICYKPDECLCDEGFRLKQFPDQNKTLKCEPICPINCLPYGKCILSMGCECYPGYALRSDIVSETEPLCQPICSQDCTNGFCTSPEVCSCNQGYLTGPKSTCEPDCSLGCLHGDCIEPEVCVCKNGYIMKSGSSNECEPICDPPCKYGDCVETGICLCWQNYEPSTNFSSSNECAPSCNPNCQNGECLSPNNCICFDGYKPDLDNVNICAPICTKCESNDCIAPEICVEIITSIDFSTDSMDIGEYIFETTINTNEIDVDVTRNDCNRHCKCWQLVDGSSFAKDLECSNVCVDDADEPCLDLETCDCSFPNLRLTCLSKELKHDGSGENDTIEYHCLVPSNLLISKANQKKTDETAKRTAFPWFAVLGSLFVVILIICLFAIAWSRFKIRGREGQYTVGFENS